MDAKTFLMYPPDKGILLNIGPIVKYTIDILLNSTPIMREYIKQRDDEFNLYNKILPSTKLYIGQRTDFTPQIFLPLDLLAIFFSIFAQYNNTENIAILPGYVSSNAKVLKACRLESTKLKFMTKDKENEIAITDNDELYITLRESLLRIIPKTAGKRLLNEGLIVYITNPNNNHWCCTFIFNIRKYIIKEETKTQLKEKSNDETDHSFELPGCFEFNSMNNPTEF